VIVSFQEFVTFTFSFTEVLLFISNSNFKGLIDKLALVSKTNKNENKNIKNNLMYFIFKN
jgi:hypothetical protein